MRKGNVPDVQCWAASLVFLLMAQNADLAMREHSSYITSACVIEVLQIRKASALHVWFLPVFHALLKIPITACNALLTSPLWEASVSAEILTPR